MQAAGQGLQLATHSFLYAGAGLIAALAPTVILGNASGLIISNAWSVASERAAKAGRNRRGGLALQRGCVWLAVLVSTALDPNSSQNLSTCLLSRTGTGASAA
jgi:hypothetical protein